MLGHGLPALYALLIWWASTGLVLYVVGMPRRTHAVTMALATLAAVIAAMALWVTADDQTLTGAFVAFTAALAIWAWHEVGFLTGIITGPRKIEHPGRGGEVKTSPAPFKAAASTVIHHEIAIALTAVGIALLTLGADNRVGFWTFVILWLMRLSAKLNIYLGVRNLTEHFLPEHLQYLKTYFCRRPMNLLFPVAVTSATVVTALLADAAAQSTTDFEAAQFTFLSMLMGLAVLEHWFMVLPIPADRLWDWGLASRRSAAAQAPDAEPVRIT